MPYDDPDPADPMTLHGVAVETNDDRSTVEMTVCFIEEYLRLGFDAERVLRMFHTAQYAGPALARRNLGDERLRTLIAEALELRGPRKANRESEATTSAGISLPVLEPDR